MNLPGSNSFSRAPTSSGEWTSYGWKNAGRGFFGGAGCGEWEKPERQYFDPTRPKEMSLGFSKDDVEYAKYSEKKNREAFQNMSERQKRLLGALESGKLFRLSKLVPED